MISRQKFLKLTALGSWAPFTKWVSPKSSSSSFSGTVNTPVVISTWRHGIAANEAAWEVLTDEGTALDAVEAGVGVTEADPDVHTVGYGGRPDRDGYVTLDACIMDHNEQCGSVGALRHIKHPISVARKVKEETPHVMLVAEGALEFAEDQGFEKQDLLTNDARSQWKEWKKNAHYSPEINIENHDTIGMLALDKSGDLSGACTTSGAAWKMHGRVGDSPLIGAGLFVDSEVGAAAATGVGEEVIRIAGSHLVVENMHRGDDPKTACRKAVHRIVNKNESVEGIQVGFIALNNQGEFGGYSIQPNFDYAVYESGQNNLINADNWTAE